METGLSSVVLPAVASLTFMKEVAGLSKLSLPGRRRWKARAKATRAVR